MADNYLITGYWGEPHVTAENDRGINAATFGAGRFVFPVGERFRAEYIGNNTVRMYDGKLMNNGAAAGIPVGEYVDLLIANAGQGMKRNDLIVFQYSQDASTLIESGKFVVIQGAETSGTASDPELTQEDLLSGEATFDQMAMWRVSVSGTTISAPVSLFTLYGYGYGETVNATPTNADANEIHHVGKYICITNCPTDDLWCVESNISIPGQFEQQKAVRAYDGKVCYRVMADGVWHDWLWEDPPMIPGVEYATTERYNDKIVYAKAMNGGEFPASGNMHIWLGTVASFPYYSLVIRDAVRAFSSTHVRNHLTRCFFREGEQIFLGIEPAPNENMAAYNVEATIWYTKL